MAKKIKLTADEAIDLGSTEGGTAQPSMAESLYADRIAAGLAVMPEDGDPSFTPGVKAALAALQVGSRLAQLVPAGTAKLVTVAAQFGITTDDLGELARIGADSINRAMFEITRAGLAFLRANELLSLGNFGNGESTVSDRSDTGGFVAWITDNGLAKQRVYEAMRIAKFVTQLPAEQLDDVLALGKVKVMLLASLSQEVIDQAAESGNDLIGKADLMTVAELKEEIALLKRREKNYEAEIERAQRQVERLSDMKKRTTEFLLRTEEIREECMALQLGAELNMASLEKLFEAVRTDGPDAPEWRLQIEQVWLTAHVVCARAMDLVAIMRNTMDTDGIPMPERIVGDHLLTPGEAERWVLDYSTIANRHEAEKLARQAKRDAAKPRGPGRPTGSKNKATV